MEDYTGCGVVWISHGLMMRDVVNALRLTIGLTHLTKRLYNGNGAYP